MILDAENDIKLSFSDTFLLPTLAVLDPELTLSLPPALTASTAMDALTHAVESFLSPEWSPWSESLATGATRLIFDTVERAVADGSDLASIFHQTPQAPSPALRNGRSQVSAHSGDTPEALRASLQSQTMGSDRSGRTPQAG